MEYFFTLASSIHHHRADVCVLGSDGGGVGVRGVGGGGSSDGSDGGGVGGVGGSDSGGVGGSIKVQKWTLTPWSVGAVKCKNVLHHLSNITKAVLRFQTGLS